MLEGYVLLVDDQPVAAQNSIEALRHYVAKEKICFVSNGAEARKLLDTGQFELVFLDIDMPDDSGFSIAAYIDRMEKKVPYVFLTGYANFAAESYDYEPLDFLTKPVDVRRMGKTFERLEKKQQGGDPGKIAVRSGQEYVFVNPFQIRYICKEKRKIWIRCKNGEEYQIYSSMEELEAIFADYGFFRCHQSFLIGVSSIKKMGASLFGQTYEAVLDDGTVVPVSRSKYAKLKKILEEKGVFFVS